MKRNRLSLRKGPPAAPAATKPPLFALGEKEEVTERGLEKSTQHKKPRADKGALHTRGVQSERGTSAAACERVAWSAQGATFDEDCRESFGLVSSGKTSAAAPSCLQSKSPTFSPQPIPSPEKHHSPSHNDENENYAAAAPIEAIAQVASPQAFLVSSPLPLPSSPCHETTSNECTSPAGESPVSISTRPGSKPDSIPVVSIIHTPARAHTGTDTQADIRDERARAEALSLWQCVFWPRESKRVAAPYKPLPGFLGTGDCPPPPPFPISTATACASPPTAYIANQGSANAGWKPLPFAVYRIHRYEPAPLTSQQPATVKATLPPTAGSVTPAATQEPPPQLSPPPIRNVDTERMLADGIHMEGDRAKVHRESAEAQPVVRVSRKSKAKDEDSGYVSAKRRRASAHHITEHTGAERDQEKTKTYEPSVLPTATTEQTSTPVRQPGVGNTVQPINRWSAANTEGNGGNTNEYTNGRQSNGDGVNSFSEAKGKKPAGNRVFDRSDEPPWPHETSEMSATRTNANTPTEIPLDPTTKRNHEANSVGSVAAKSQSNQQAPYMVMNLRFPAVSGSNRASDGEQPRPNKVPARHTANGAQRKVSPYANTATQARTDVQNTRLNPTPKQTTDWGPTRAPQQMSAEQRGNTPRGSGADGRKVKQATLTPGGLIKEKKSQQCPICGDTMAPGISNQQLNAHINDCLQASGMVD